MGWGPVGDLVSPDEVYEALRWNAPDVRKGVDFVNQFVAFWANDVAAALAEGNTSRPEWNTQGKGGGDGGEIMIKREASKHMHHLRPTFEEFFETIVIEPLTWDFPSGNVHEDGWGTPVVPVETPKKWRNGTEGMNWVTHKNGKGNKRGTGRGKGKGRTGREPSSDVAGKSAQVASRNLFAQVSFDIDFESIAFTSNIL